MKLFRRDRVRAMSCVAVGRQCTMRAGAGQRLTGANAAYLEAGTR